MHTNKLPAVAVALLFATALVPNGQADPGWFDHYKDAFGPIGLQAKDGLSVTFVYCQTLDPGLPGACDPNPGVIPGLGGAIFFVDGSEHPAHDWNSEAFASASYGRYLRIWIEQIDGPSLGGFGAAFCADRTDTLTCSDGDDLDHPMVYGWASDHSDCQKDKKNCKNPLDLEMHVCVPKDNYAYERLNDDGTVTTGVDNQYDDFYVFIEAWLDVADPDAGGTGLLENQKDNTGVGLSMGTFRIYVDWDVFLLEQDCLLENESDQDATGGGWNGWGWGVDPRI